MGKGEIARFEQFLLFPQCFLLNQIIVSPFVHIFDIITLFAAELKEPIVGISGKGLTVWRIMKKCRIERTVRINKGRSGRPKSVRNQDSINTVCLAVRQSPKKSV